MPKVNKIEIIINAQDKSTKVLGGVGKALGGLGKIAAGAGVAVAVAAAGIGVALGALAVQAAPLEGIGIAFDKMADRVGLSLEELREASAGTISDFELMRKANIALTGAGEQLGVEFGKNMPALLEAARAAARATGQDVDFLFESLVTGVKRGSPMLIDNTGLVVKLGEANEAMAKKLGKTVQELTAEEKQIALLNATVEAGRKMVDEFGGGTLTAAEKMAQFRATLQNTKDQIGLAMLPALQALLEPLAGLAQEYGPQVVALAQQLGEWLGENLPIAIEKLTALLSGEMPASFQTAWGIIEPIVTAIRDIIVGQVWPALQEAFANLTEALNELGLDWGDVWEAVKTGIVVVAAIIGAVVVGIIAALTSIITALAKVLAHVTSVMKDMAKTFKKGLESIAKIVGGVMAVVRGIFQGDTDLIKAGIDAFASGIVGLIEVMGEGVVNAIKLTFGTVIQAVVTFVSTFINFFVDLASELVGGSVVQDMMDSMLDIITTTLSDILSAIAGFVSDMVSALSALGTKIADEIGPKLQSFKTNILEPLATAFGTIKDAVKKVVDFLGDLKDMIESIELPDWMTPGSATPFELGLKGIAKAIRQEVSPAIREMTESLNLDIVSNAALSTVAAVGAAAGAARTTNYYFDLTVNTRAETSPVVESFETMRALVG